MPTAAFLRWPTAYSSFSRGTLLHPTQEKGSGKKFNFTLCSQGHQRENLAGWQKWGDVPASYLLNGHGKCLITQREGGWSNVNSLADE